MIPWLRWVTLGVAALIFVLAIAIPVATCDKESEGKAPVSSSETSEESSSDGEHKHNWAVTIIKMSDCETDGEMLLLCEGCGSFERVTTEATGHNYVEYGEEAAECMTDGTTAYEQCKNCGDYKVKPQTIPALGHNYVDGVCANCGEKEAVTVGAIKYELSADGTYYTVAGLEAESDATEIVIPSAYKGLPVKEIQDEAFKNCTQITSVTISGQKIGKSAFEGCAALKEIDLSNKLQIKSIGIDAFKNTGVYATEANWQNNVLYIGNYLIAVREAYFGAFDVKDGVVTIADKAFSTSKVTRVGISNSVVNVGYRAFENCKSLTDVSVGSGVTKLPASAFSGCTALSVISVNEANRAFKSLDDGNLYSKDGKTLVMYAPGQMQTSFTVSEGVETIGDNAFYACKLEEIVLPTTLKKIGNNAFAASDSLTYVTIPESVTMMGIAAFYQCENLESVYFDDVTGWYLQAPAETEMTAVSDTELSDSTTAAEYLTSEKAIFYWRKN